MNKIKITEQDVNRKFKTRDGRIFRIVRFVVGHGYYSVLALVTDEYASVDCKNAITLTDEGSYNAFTAGSSQYDFKEWADEDEKMGSKIELKVGQKVKFRNGGTGTVISERDDKDNYPFSIKNHIFNEKYYYTKDGFFYETKIASNNDVIEILEEPKDKEMKNKIKLKVGQKVKFRDGTVGEIIRKTKNHNYDFIAINYNDSLLKTSHQEDGFFYPRRDNALYDIVEILEEPKKEEMEENLKENKGKFELSITVNDINNSCKNDKYYFTGSLDLSKDIRNLSFGDNVLYQILPNIEVLSSKNDTFKFSKSIKLNDKELGKVTIRVTQLRD